MIPKIWCYLFGHKYWYKTDVIGGYGEIFTSKRLVDECQRCYRKKEN